MEDILLEGREEDSWNVYMGKGSMFQHIKDIFTMRWFRPAEANTSYGIKYFKNRGFSDNEIQNIRDSLHEAFKVYFLKRTNKLPKKEPYNFYGWLIPVDLLPSEKELNTEIKAEFIKQMKKK